MAKIFLKKLILRMVSKHSATWLRDSDLIFEA